MAHVIKYMYDGAKVIVRTNKGNILAFSTMC